MTLLHRIDLVCVRDVCLEGVSGPPTGDAVFEGPGGGERRAAGAVRARGDLSGVRGQGSGRWGRRSESRRYEVTSSFLLR